MIAGSSRAPGLEQSYFPCRPGVPLPRGHAAGVHGVVLAAISTQSASGMAGNRGD